MSSLRYWLKWCIAGAASFLLCHCMFFNKKDVAGDGEEPDTVSAVSERLGGKTTSASDRLLEDIYSISSTHPPAAVRPDPDLMVRRTLRLFRAESATLAREIGRVEDFRLLLGGANSDFSKPPQETYDATSLLAVQKVASEVCTGLVAPVATQHPGWQTILPAAASDTTTNLKFLAQRLLGKPSAEIDAQALSDWNGMLKKNSAGEIVLSSYVPACVAILLDAEGLLL